MVKKNLKEKGGNMMSSSLSINILTRKVTTNIN